MILPLTFFISSGFVMFFLVLHKYMERAFGSGLIVKSILHKVDDWSHRRYAELKRVVSYFTRRNTVLILNYFIVYFLRAFITLGSAIKKGMLYMIEKLVRRQEVLTKHGAASAYLKHISEIKQGGRTADL